MTIAERFWPKVDTSAGPDACWPWMSTRIPKGYGQFWVDRKYHPATHIAVQLDGRPVPPGLIVLHRCDNPPCVNPAHLIVGTLSDNSRDAVAKGRNRGNPFPHRYGADAAHAILTAEQVASIRATYTGARGEQTAMGRQYGVDPSTIGLIVRGKRWRTPE